jgi:hypothetical protein
MCFRIVANFGGEAFMVRGRRRDAAYDGRLGADLIDRVEGRDSREILVDVLKGMGIVGGELEDDFGSRPHDGLFNHVVQLV